MKAAAEDGGRWQQMSMAAAALGVAADGSICIGNSCNGKQLQYDDEDDAYVGDDVVLRMMLLIMSMMKQQAASKGAAGCKSCNSM